jgi:RNA-directed DNA polymerase
MMHGREKSDLAVVAAKPANNDGRPSAELVERRAGAEGNAGQDRTRRAQDRASVSKGLDRVRHVARQRKKERFTALLHHVTPDLLRTAFFALKRQAAPGVDGLTWQAYEADLDRRIESLHERVHRGAYRALPARRGFIPKADGSQRPLAIAVLEDKIVQRATAAVLNAIYEEDFLGFSYGFRPGRGAHDALDALAVGINPHQGEPHLGRRHPVVLRSCILLPSSRTQFCAERDLIQLASPQSAQLVQGAGRIGEQV